MTLRTLAFSIAVVLAVVALAVFNPRAHAAGESIVDTVHNLSAGGPGTVKATGETQVCIFCHTPHHATPVQPLWNRNLPVNAYKTYSSNSLKAKPGQPTGSSKLCLSCHDGTIALGAVNSRAMPIPMANGITTIPPGSTNLGTDLSDDHPISFKYDSTLATQNTKLKDPASLPAAVKLDVNNELQCATCHDPHKNTNGKFLVMTNTNAELCSTCHTMGTSDPPAHQPCASCHKPHTAPSGPYLLAKEKTSETCLTCHSGLTGSNQGANIAAALNQISKHDTASPVNLPNHAPSNVTCADCHEPHTMKTAAEAAAPNIPANLGKISGVNVNGTVAANAQFTYEVCFKCHADKSAIATPHVPRVITQTNTRLEFANTAISFHPVVAKGKNTDVPSLKAPYTTNSIIYCTDCHASSNSQKAGGSGPNGPHGSAFTPLLIARYDTADFTAESSTAYALCYRCHDRTKIMDESGPFKYHKKHVQEERTPCSACHDSHGISSTQGTAVNNAHLINFDTSIVKPDSQNRLRYEKTGVRQGRCYLECHSKVHSPLSY